MPKAVPLAMARVAGAIQAARYKALGGPEPKISSTALAVMAAGQFISGEKAAGALGFVAQVSTDEAIRRTLGWFQSRGMIGKVARAERR